MNKLKDLISSSKASKSSFSEFLYEMYKDKFVEIYLGDEYERLNIDQISTSYPAIICGKVLGAFDKCFIINSIYIDQKSKVTTLGNIICINDDHIKMISEINEEGILRDCFIKSKDRLNIKQLFGK